MVFIVLKRNMFIIHQALLGMDAFKLVTEEDPHKQMSLFLLCTILLGLRTGISRVIVNINMTRPMSSYTARLK